jgi:hypothetical protein
MVATPSEPFDRRQEDVGNIIAFGHLNVRVPDQRLALLFYVQGLGLTRDPQMMTGTDNAWINVGTSQFHLPTGPAQVLRGRVVLVMPDLRALAARLAAVAPALAGTAFRCEHGADHVELSCPWGNRLRVHAPDAARFGAMRLGMPALELDAAPGTAAGIARFYREVLAAPARVEEDRGAPLARVVVGPGEQLLFRETPSALPPYDGHHIQISVADFSGVHQNLLERGLITEESNRSQYRFQDITDAASGAVLATLEHEVRSLRHPQHARALVNSGPASG